MTTPSKNPTGTQSEKRQLTGRFAPSPTGRMHAGNIYAALLNWLIVRSSGGRMVLRIEDLDRERSKPEFIDAIMRDLEFLGLDWDVGPYYQHDNDERYEEVFVALDERGLIYPCFCTRAELHAASAPHFGEKTVYPGTCRHLTADQRAERSRTRHPAYRLIVPDETIEIDDMIQGTYTQNLALECGDFLVKRSDGAFAYQLAVVVDDADEGVNFVARGVDLLSSTPQQRYLQHLMGFPTCSYAHVPLLVASHNRRLSKRDHDASFDEMLKRYKTAAGIIGHIAYVVGLSQVDEPQTPSQLLKTFDPARLDGMFPDLVQIPWVP